MCIEEKNWRWPLNLFALIHTLFYEMNGWWTQNVRLDALNELFIQFTWIEWDKNQTNNLMENNKYLSMWRMKWLWAVSRQSSIVSHHQQKYLSIFFPFQRFSRSEAWKSFCHDAHTTIVMPCPVAIIKHEPRTKQLQPNRKWNSSKWMFDMMKNIKRKKYCLKSPLISHMPALV